MKNTITLQIEVKAFQFLEKCPEGLHTSELLRMIKTSDSALHPKTINGTIWKLPDKFPEKVYKPERGLLRLTKFK
jgi:hypothetical protein